jgi:hypothetical protein
MNMWRLKVYDDDKLLEVIECGTADGAKTKATKMRYREHNIVEGIWFELFAPDGVPVCRTKKDLSRRLKWEWIPGRGYV